ncbi:hypothetical protein A2V68_02285 [candidate division Kazan bacterium RBG_13_50_9]|uniref:Bifunctional protein FolD n=1 Tax=candidate division Kazan bacterium RBG_13_50_9 TaxID=1798535 RepID=A0A1F4NSA7_UNCK3|nr:MAG: hypothetical protein A2V68_02285 [candidate division Kazan bacterium RBG_13_50_9]
MKLLDGKDLAAQRRRQLKRQVAALRRRGVVPGLAVVMVGENPASQVYVRNKKNYSCEVGVRFWLRKFSAGASEAKIIGAIKKLNQDKRVHGIILQLPLPSRLDSLKVISAIDPIKDVDGLHPMNLGLLAAGRPLFLPATPKGILDLLDHYQIDVQGKRVAVVGFGLVVGMPLSLALLHLKATVVVAHGQTKDLGSISRSADIIVTAAGVPNLIKGSMVRAGAVVVDAGISKVGGKLVGDVELKTVARKASYLTPVPGGVGPMTVSSLIANVVQAAKGF